MPKCYQLIGVPGSGKTTWINDQTWAKDCAVVSTDQHVENYANSQGKTYTEVFDEYMPTAVKLMAQEIVDAQQTGKDIVWDQTSTTIQSRKRKFNMLPEYDHIAVVFKTPSEEELKIRLRSRPGKVIPQRVIIQMTENFEMPTESEGFKEIWYT